MTQAFPVLSVIGTTAVGKTNFAFLLADQLEASKKYTGVDIISADSRQIYQGLEILSGADIPEAFEQKKNLSVSAFRFFQKNSIRLFGISCLLPDQEWSVSQFQVYARALIEAAQRECRAVLVVGGTGLYHEHLFSTDNALHVPPNPKLRQLLQTASVHELQTLLEKNDRIRFLRMNNSDRNNPRRLVRALEIASTGLIVSEQEEQNHDLSDYNHHLLGLRASLDFIIPKIKNRVIQRLNSSVLEEVSTLQEKYGERLAVQVKKTLGFEQIIEILEQRLTVAEAVTRWSAAEKQYAQRQITWWKAHEDVKWFDVDQATEWQKQALEFSRQHLVSAC